MSKGDFYGHEESHICADDTQVKIVFKEHDEDAKEVILLDNIACMAGEVIDSTYMSIYYL